MSGTPSVLLVSALTIVVAACGGGDDASDNTVAADPTNAATTAAPTTEPEVTAAATTPVPTTAAPATTAPPGTAPATTAPPTKVAATAPPTTAPAEVVVALGDAVTAANGLVSMRIADGWTITSTEEFITTGFEDSEGLAWEPRDETLQEILVAERGDVVMGVFRETRFGLVDNVFDWDSGLVEILNMQPNFSLTREWAGGRGNSTQGRLGDAYIRLDTVEAGGQYIGVVSISPDQPTEQLNAEVVEMTESMIIDPSVIEPLSHVIDLTVTLTNETADGPEMFAISVLAPPTWVEDPDINAYWRDPAINPESGPIPSLDVYSLIDPDLTVDGYITQEFLDRAQGWLSVDPVIEERSVDVAPMTIFWEGEPGEAEAAVVMAGTNDMYVAAYIWVPDDPATVSAMVDSVLFTLTP